MIIVHNSYKMIIVLSFYCLANQFGCRVTLMSSCDQHLQFVYQTHSHTPIAKAGGDEMK